MTIYPFWEGYQRGGVAGALDEGVAFGLVPDSWYGE
jgi:hypothetical protein